MFFLPLCFSAGFRALQQRLQLVNPPQTNVVGRCGGGIRAPFHSPPFPSMSLAR